MDWSRGLAIGLAVGAFLSCGDGTVQIEPPTCGNGKVDRGESCDGNCPGDCNDNDACTQDTLAGSAARCTATCVNEVTATCTGGDGCCPAGCTEATDNDCRAGPDGTPPTIGITSPIDNQKVTTATIPVSGVASDDVAVTKVEVKVGAGPSGLASGTTLWSKTVELSVGSNTIYAKASDISGNTKEVSVTVTYVAESACGNHVIDAGEACDTDGDVGCGSPTPVCRYDCQECVTPSVVVNPDKTISINGKKVFPVSMYEICSWVHDDIESCPASLAATSNFTYSHDSMSGLTSYWDSVSPFFADAGIYYSTRLSAASIGDRKNERYFFGYNQQPGEPSSAAEYDNLFSRYNAIKADDPNHPVMVPMWTYKPSGSTYDASQVADIVEHVNYNYHTNCGFTDRFNEYADCETFGHYLDDFIFASERILRSNVLDPANVDSIEELPKPLFLLDMGSGVDWTEGIHRWHVIPEDKLRALAYWGITAGYSGIGFWGYKFWGDGTVTYGLVMDATIAAYYNRLAGELSSPEIQNVFLLPTTNYSWNHGVAWDNKVTFSVNPTRVAWGWVGYSLTYRLKFDATTGWYYLIIVNKSNASVEPTITVSGLTSTLDATTMGITGTGSSAPGQVHTVIDGVFTDTFDAYAAHVYCISPKKLPHVRPRHSNE